MRLKKKKVKTLNQNIFFSSGECSLFSYIPKESRDFSKYLESLTITENPLSFILLTYFSQGKFGHFGSV